MLLVNNSAIQFYNPSQYTSEIIYFNDNTHYTNSLINQLRINFAPDTYITLLNRDGRYICKDTPLPIFTATYHNRYINDTIDWKNSFIRIYTTPDSTGNADTVILNIIYDSTYTPDTPTPTLIRQYNVVGAHYTPTPITLPGDTVPTHRRPLSTIIAPYNRHGNLIRIDIRNTTTDTTKLSIFDTIHIIDQKGRNIALSLLQLSRINQGIDYTQLHHLNPNPIYLNHIQPDYEASYIQTVNKAPDYELKLYYTK